jgi:hypothetical protein
MQKITEMVPENMPNWAKDAFDKGQFFYIACDRVEKYEKVLKSIAMNTCCDKCQEAALVAMQALIDNKCESI